MELATPPPPLERRANSAYRGKPDVVAMRDHSYYFLESDGHAVIDVIRLGDCTTQVEVGYTTVVTDAAGENDDFTHVHGTLVFAPGDGIKSFSVPLTDDDRWEPVEYFKAKLTVIEQGNAVFGELVCSTIYIVDDDNFPQNFPCLEAEPATAPQPWELMWGFIKERWMVLHPKPLKSHCYRAYESFHQVLSTYIISSLVVDMLVQKLRSNPNDELTREDWVFLNSCAAVYTASNVIRWWTQFKFMDNCSNRGTRADLRNWLVHKYIYFSERIHVEIDETRFYTCAIHSVEEAVNNGWFLHYELASELFELCFQLAYALYISKFAIIPIAILLPVIGTTILLKQGKFDKLIANRTAASHAWLDMMMDISKNRMVINAYGARDDRCRRFSSLHTRFEECNDEKCEYQFNYQWITKFANELMIVGSFMLGARLITGPDPTMTIGEFSAVVRICSRVGGRVVKISDILIKLHRGIEGLREVSDMLNCPVGVNEEVVVKTAQANTTFKAIHKTSGAPGSCDTQRVASIKWQKAITSAKAGRLRNRSMLLKGRVICAFEKQQAICTELIETYLVKTTQSAQQSTDSNSKTSAHRSGSVIEPYLGNWTEDMIKGMLSIQLDQVTFAYPDAKELSGQIKMLNNLTAVIPLGYFIALVPEMEKGEAGSGGGGVTTLMKLITSQLYSTRGEVRVPAHLRTLMVHHEPLILADPLLENLLFGNERDVDEAFVWKVAEALGLSTNLLGKGGMLVGVGGFGLRRVDREVVCLARALLADPHVLVCAKPAANFATQHASKVFAVLKDWQELKGLWEGAGRGHEATPGQDQILNTRTVIFGVPCNSHDFPEEVDLLATVCHMERGTQIKLEPRKPLLRSRRQLVGMLDL